MLGVIFFVLRILAAVALFAFLGWALRLIWLDLNRQSRAAMQSSTPSLVLRPQNELDLDNFRARSLELVVGRDPACELCLKDNTISGQHARLAYSLGQWWVEDLQSTNGTYLNGQPVASAVVLTTGDELRFGQIAFGVSISQTE
jgi:hypothetical protein